MLNFKCVDYFQVQWYDPYNVADTFMTTGKIGRHTRDFVIDVKPCKDYAFRVNESIAVNIFSIITLRDISSFLPGDSF